MVDSLNINGPVEIKDNSKERVAFDLMLRISNAENPSAVKFSKEQQTRLYWLKLYNQCIKVVSKPSLTSDDITKITETTQD